MGGTAMSDGERPFSFFVSRHQIDGVVHAVHNQFLVFIFWESSMVLCSPWRMGFCVGLRGKVFVCLRVCATFLNYLLLFVYLCIHVLTVFVCLTEYYQVWTKECHHAL